MTKKRKNKNKKKGNTGESIILVINQLNVQILVYTKFNIFLYMFRALCAHHQEVKIVYAASGIVTPVGGRSVHRLREDSQICIIQHLVSSHL